MEKNLKEHPIGGMDETYRREFISASDKVKLDAGLELSKMQ